MALAKRRRRHLDTAGFKVSAPRLGSKSLEFGQRIAREGESKKSVAMNGTSWRIRLAAAAAAAATGRGFRGALHLKSQAIAKQAAALITLRKRSELLSKHKMI